MKNKFEEPIDEREEGSVGEIRDLKTEKEGNYSVITWILEKDGGEFSFRLKIDDKTGKVAERRWTRKNGAEEELLHYENFEAMRKLPRFDTQLDFKAIEEEVLKLHRDSK